jgi:asparagine synthase (glutamine-hydrolysing)
MCGIAGIVNLDTSEPVAESALRSMLASLRHRGPDEFGFYIDENAGIGNARLSIIDLSGGSQPIPNEDESLWIVFNGEIFNYIELRAELKASGHRFTTHSDTEVILHLYEELGPGCLHRLNGQFAIAIWNRDKQELFLARDRLGVRPLFFTRSGGALCFGSEIKALFNGTGGTGEIEPSSLLDVFTYWSPRQGGTVFRGISELPPGHWLTVRNGEVALRKYWELDFSKSPDAATRSEDDYLDEFRELLVDAARIRLRADVPVGAYLSGGLDSSAITAIVRKYTSNRLNTFSIAFTDQNFDEREHQRRMADYLGTTHHVVEATHSDIARVFPDVIWHTEAPLLRTAPAPMLMLSKLVRETGFKVVLTGEGADEFLAGYDIFKESKVRRFWARHPESQMRPALLRQLYPDIFKSSASSGAFLTAFFGEGLGDVDDPGYSHALRWRNNRRTWRFLSDEVLHAGTATPREQIAPLLPTKFGQWGPLERAQFIEAATFLSQYLLSSQGDRMAMANSVEGRYPFLDYRVVEFCNRLPSTLKMRGLREKRLLRRLADDLLPRDISQRRKRPYRAPIHRSFFGTHSPDYVRELLSPVAIKRSGLFSLGAVGQLVAKLDHGKPLGETDDMALAGILSTQLLHELFIERFRPALPLDESKVSKVCRRQFSRKAPG